MPDHLHLFVVLGAEAPLANAIRLFKGRTSPVLRGVKLSWQRGYFDHRVRATLVGAAEKWPGYYCAREDWAWFSALAEHECPLPEWLV
jgi:REP element-mobilizing transposase RayT